MAMIRIDHLTFTYPNGSEPVFEDVSLQFDDEWRLGLIGRNGKGKTTLLRLLAGEYEYQGRISGAPHCEYYPFTVKDPQQFTSTIIEELCPNAALWQIRRELNALEVSEDVLWRSFDILSKGEQSKILLAVLFLKEADCYLIDEPTNHLDAKGRIILSAYLQKKKGFLLVSHDRDLLDACVDHILALNRSSVQISAGNFSLWKEHFDQQQHFEQVQNERLKKDLKRLSQASRRTAEWSDRIEASKIGAADKGYVGHQAAKMMKRSKVLEKRRQNAIEEKAKLLKDIQIVQDLKITPLSHRKKILLNVDKVVIRYDKRNICQPLSFTLTQHDRILLSGQNGSGKSSLLKLIMGEPMEHSGTIHKPNDLRISYVAQDTSHLHGSLHDYIKASDFEEALFRTLLHKLDFPRHLSIPDLTKLSQGQKKKILIASSLSQKAHLYIWDEPLNDIDIYIRMQIEQLIHAFSPPMLFIEHDQAFQNAIATQIIPVIGIHNSL